MTLEFVSLVIDMGLVKVTHLVASMRARVEAQHSAHHHHPHLKQRHLFTL